MTDIPPDVRDRAARAAQLSDAGGSWIPVWDSFHDENREYWRAIVDAVAEVLAAEQRPPNDYSGGPARSERELLLEAQVAGLEEELEREQTRQTQAEARVIAERDTLKSQLGQELAHQRQAAIDYSNTIGPMVRERDALKARVAEQEIAFAEKLAGAADASTRHVKQLSERVDLLTAALTGLCDVYHARPLNELLDGEETVSEDDGPKFAAWANARAVLSATPTARYVVQNRGAAWAVHDNERHMDISLYTDEQFTQEFCQRMNTTPTGSET